MPALVDQPNVMRVRTTWELGADLNVASQMHFLWSGTTPDNASCASLATSAHASAVTNLVPLLGTESSLRSVEFTDLSTPSSGTGEHIALTTGTRSGSDIPAGSCVLMNIQIPRRYRGGKPRVYWPLGTASDMDTPTNWLSGSVTAFLAGIAQYIDDIIALTHSGTIMGSLVNISYYSGFTAVLNPITGRTRDVPTPRTVAITPDVFTGISVNERVGSQRRRNLMGS